MKGRTIVLDHIGDTEAAALLVDGVLDDLLVDSDAPRPGTIYRAIADRPVKGQGGMFLRTPDGAAFLRQIKGLSPGQPLLVQVTGCAEPGKAIPVTQKLLFKSRYVIVTPGAPGLNVSRSIRDEDRRDSLLEIAHAEMDANSMGLILRSSCVDAYADEIAEDIRGMADLAHSVMGDVSGDAETLTEGDAPHLYAWREWRAEDVHRAPDGFADLGVLDQMEALREPLVPLSGGAALYIEPTRALVAVDVNTGGDTSPAAALKANLACASALPRQLRLRGLGGQITLDLAPMAKKDRRAFESALRAAFRADPTETALVGWTPLGHFELQRKRDRIPLEACLR
ncbi:ribonuclease G [Pseudohalocynthiibacter aestuariivivens]|nr:ribonuclease E/G [Pseudohalocynthiibacter aestuariivivens]QIE45046.1 ribonuclease G [Pseudohalocynthiibacter aestuariivivens]